MATTTTTKKLLSRPLSKTWPSHVFRRDTRHTRSSIGHTLLPAVPHSSTKPTNHGEVPPYPVQYVWYLAVSARSDMRLIVSLDRSHITQDAEWSKIEMESSKVLHDTTEWNSTQIHFHYIRGAWQIIHMRRHSCESFTSAQDHPSTILFIR